MDGEDHKIRVVRGGQPLPPPDYTFLRSKSRWIQWFRGFGQIFRIVLWLIHNPRVFHLELLFYRNPSARLALRRGQFCMHNAPNLQNGDLLEDKRDRWYPPTKGFTWNRKLSGFPKILATNVEIRSKNHWIRN